MSEAALDLPPTLPVPGEEPERKEIFQTGNPLVDHLCKELEITTTEYQQALETKRKLAEEGIFCLASQLDGYKDFEHTWLPGPDNLPKISPIDVLGPFLPENVLEEGIKRGVFAQYVISQIRFMQGAEGIEKEEVEKLTEILKEKAKQVVLGLLAEGEVSRKMGIELHCETDKGALNPEHWDYVLTIYRLLANAHLYRDFDPFESEGIQLPPNPENMETAHLAFMWITNGETEKEQRFYQRIERRLQEAKQEEPELIPWDPNDLITHKALQLFWQAPKGVEINGQQYMKFSMFFPSGEIPPSMRAFAEQADFIESNQEMRAVLERAGEISASYSVHLFKEQMKFMQERYGITHFTCHAVPLAGTLHRAEFQRLNENLLNLAKFCQENDLRLAVETQGLTETQYENLFNAPDLKNFWGKTLGITVDLVHVAAENRVLPDRPPLEYWLQKIKKGVVFEIHVSASEEAHPEQYAQKGFVPDAHVGIKTADPKLIVPGLEETVKAVVAYNKTAIEQGRSGIVIAQEATLTQLDIEELAEQLQ